MSSYQGCRMHRLALDVLAHVLWCSTPLVLIVALHILDAGHGQSLARDADLGMITTAVS